MNAGGKRPAVNAAGTIVSIKERTLDPCVKPRPCSALPTLCLAPPAVIPLMTDHVRAQHGRPLCPLPERGGAPALPERLTDEATESHRVFPETLPILAGLAAGAPDKHS